jgi:hypothetical protein
MLMGICLVIKRSPLRASPFAALFAAADAIAQFVSIEKRCVAVDTLPRTSGISSKTAGWTGVLSSCSVISSKIFTCFSGQDSGVVCCLRHLVTAGSGTCTSMRL